MFLNLLPNQALAARLAARLAAGLAAGLAAKTWFGRKFKNCLRVVGSYCNQVDKFKTTMNISRHCLTMTLHEISPV